MSEKNIPKISVLMPAYNTEKYISEAIESILNQTFRDFEFIIIDDGSIDATWSIIENYKDKDLRIVAQKNIKNLGITKTRNKLISLAKGEYIVWQDADDISLNERLEKQFYFMEKNPEVGVCGGYLQLFNEKGNLGIRKYATDDTSLRRSIFRFNPVAQPAAIMRTKCFKESGMYNENLALTEDLEILFKIGTKYKFANIPEVLVRYRQHSNSATFSKLRNMEMAALKIRKNYARTYSMTAFDKLYNSLQFLSIFILPPKIKIWLFNLFRNSK